MAKNQAMEDKVLKLSIMVLIIFAVSGIIFGLILSSDVIIFDGIFFLY